MKYLILVPDGCGDWPLPLLTGKTPLEAADIPHADALARAGLVGLVRTIPEGISPGSDAANLSILGYDPAVHLTGRASLEAAAMGLAMAQTDTAFRVNLLTLAGDGPYEELRVQDHSAGNIGGDEAAELISAINHELGSDMLRFYPGVGYRCLMIAKALGEGCTLTPPHDILDQPTGAHLPRGGDGETLRNLMIRSHALLSRHPVNLRRAALGLPPANSIWFWGAGKKPALPSFAERRGVRGSVITAVNLIKGIGLCAGLLPVDVPGADGTIDTNYAGKALAAIHEFQRGQDFVFVHVEGPDECSHSGDLDGKLRALSLIDEHILGPLAHWLAHSGEPYRILLLPDHKTPLKTRTHCAEPVPFVLFDSEVRLSPNIKNAFSEAAGAEGRFFESGGDLADYFFRKPV